MTTQTKTTREDQPTPVVSSGGSRGGLLALLSVALVGGVMYSAYQFGKRPGDGLAGGAVLASPGPASGSGAAPGAAAPTLVADAPLRSAPENPGGRVAPDQNRAAYESLGSRPIDIEPASARVTVLETAQETERPLGPMTPRAVDSAADTAALRARNTEIHSIGLAAVPPRADMVRPAETFSLDAPDRDLAAPGVAAALSGGAPAARGPVAAGPRIATAQLGAPAGSAQAGPTLAAAQALAQGPGAGAAPAGFGPSAAAPGAPATAPAVLSEAPQAAPAPRPRPTPAAAPSVVSAVRAMAGVDVSATGAAAPGTAAIVAAAPTAQPAANTGFAPQPARTFAPGQATMTLGQEFAAAAPAPQVDPRLAAAQAAQAEAQRQAQQLEAQRQAEALRLAQAPAQPWGAPVPAPAPAPQQFAAAPQPAYAPPAQARGAGAQIQLGALPSPDQVQQRWFALQQRNPDLLGGLQLDIQPVTTGAGQQLFRLRAGPLTDQRAARNLCAALQARGVDCFAPNS